MPTDNVVEGALRIPNIRRIGFAVRTEKLYQRCVKEVLGWSVASEEGWAASKHRLRSASPMRPFLTRKNKFGIKCSLGLLGVDCGFMSSI